MNAPLIGSHPAIVKIRELINMVSGMNLNVLLLGETGTGKGVVAHQLYYTSSKQKKRFVKVNCAALPMTLLESELFGYEKGAFTGADKLKPGKFELASGGVIFLDEIGDMPLSLQSKLLNVLQSGNYNRLGGTKTIKANAWVISSTNHDLNKDINSGLFREDLYYRLNIIKIELPPLRDRIEDIPLLIDYFIKRNQMEVKLEKPASISPELTKLFNKYHWPGNVRELSSVILRLSVGDDPEKIKDELSNNLSADNKYTKSAYRSMEEETGNLNVANLKEVKAQMSNYIEKKAIRHVMKMTGNNKSETAKILKISYKTLFNKMNELGLS